MKNKKIYYISAMIIILLIGVRIFIKFSRGPSLPVNKVSWREFKTRFNTYKTEYQKYCFNGWIVTAPDNSAYCSGRYLKFTDDFSGEKYSFPWVDSMGLCASQSEYDKIAIKYLDKPGKAYICIAFFNQSPSVFSLYNGVEFEWKDN